MRLELDALGADGDVSVSFSFRQRAASEEWCASPPLSVILGAAAAEDEGLDAMRARLRGGMLARWGGNKGKRIWTYSAKKLRDSNH